MTTATPTYPTLGHELAAKPHRSQIRRGRRRPRAKRTTKRPPPKPRGDPRVAPFKRQLERTPNGRRVLQFVEQAAEARLAEEVAQCGLETAEATERKLRERLCAVAPLRTAEAYREAERLHGDLYGAEHETRRWRAEYRRHRGERERLEAELRHLAGYL